MHSFSCSPPSFSSSLSSHPSVGFGPIVLVGFGVRVSLPTWVGEGVFVFPWTGTAVPVGDTSEVAVGGTTEVAVAEATAVDVAEATGVAVAVKVLVGTAVGMAVGVLVAWAGWSVASPGKVRAVSSARLVKPSPSESRFWIATRAAVLRPWER